MGNSQNLIKLQEVLNYLKNSFVGKNEIIDILGISLIARENAFLFGPPGTAKSAIVRMLSACIEKGKNFEYLLTRFTEPNEIFGPFDIRKLKDGELVTNTDGMMPEASMVFLDEIFNANSAILNSLLTSLNERTFRRGKETLKLPTLMFVSASNLLPEDEALAALLDRFLMRVRCDYVDTDLIGEVLLKGRSLEKSTQTDMPTITPNEIMELQSHCLKIDLSLITETYVELIHRLRNAGVKVSDRRAVKLQNLIASSALICGRDQAEISDLWVLKYIWDTEEQIEILAGIVNQILEKSSSEKAHPQSKLNTLPDAEELASDIDKLLYNWQNDKLSLDEQNTMKDKLRYLQSRVNWVSNKEHRTFLQEKVDLLWSNMLKSV
ncbi:MAG: AAA family ATPase [Flavobacteriales bacterium]|nr:AAA family ATPase [Flavobacteriales bacterium]